MTYSLCGSRPSPTFPKKLDMAPARCNKCKDLEAEIAELKNRLARITEQLGNLKLQNLDSKIQAAVGEQFEKERCRKARKGTLPSSSLELRKRKIRTLLRWRRFWQKWVLTKNRFAESTGWERPRKKRRSAVIPKPTTIAPG